MVNTKESTRVMILPSFINYYQCFIVEYSKCVALLTELQKKEHPWRWLDKYELAFQDLKTTVLEESVLKLSNYRKSFEVHTYSSDFSIRVLM